MKRTVAFVLSLALVAIFLSSCGNTTPTNTDLSLADKTTAPTSTAQTSIIPPAKVIKEYPIGEKFAETLATTAAIDWTQFKKSENTAAYANIEKQLNLINYLQQDVIVMTATAGRISSYNKSKLEYTLDPERFITGFFYDGVSVNADEKVTPLQNFYKQDGKSATRRSSTDAWTEQKDIAPPTYVLPLIKNLLGTLEPNSFYEVQESESEIAYVYEGAFDTSLALQVKLVFDTHFSGVAPDQLQAKLAFIFDKASGTLKQAYFTAGAKNKVEVGVVSIFSKINAQTELSEKGP